MGNKADEVRAKAADWLIQAHEHSTAVWSTKILKLAELKPMRIDETEGGYQRPISEARVDDLADKFDAGEAREIYVSERDDGSKWIVDGQHTWAVLFQRMGITLWPCRVFVGLSVAEEARRFAEYQNNTRRIPPVVQFNAEVIAKDPTAVALDRILGDFYLRISSSKLRSKDGYLGVTSRAVFQKIYELGGEKLLREVLQLAIDAWGQNQNSFLGRVLQGLGYLFAYSDGEFERGRMVAVMKNTTPKSLLEAIGPTGSGGASRAGAVLFLEKYLEGCPGYPKIRHNAKEAPNLPDHAPKDGPTPHDIWVEGTESEGKVDLHPVEKVTPEFKPKDLTATNDDVTIVMEDGATDSSNAQDSDKGTDGGPHAEAPETPSEPSLAEDEEWEYQQAQNA